MDTFRAVRLLRTPRRSGRVLAVAGMLLAVCSVGAAPAGAHGRPSHAASRDRDRDGLPDRFERRHSRTDPRRADTDGDGLSDGAEVRRHHTNPRKADTDGDGINDGAEVKAGTNPRDPRSPGPKPTGGGTPPPPPGGGTPPPPTGGGTPPPPTGGGTPPPPPPPADTTAPETTIASGTSGPQSATTASFTFTANEAATFQCSIDNGPYAACTSPKTYTGLADGPHDFAVRAKDAAGNVDATPATRAWSVDTAAPVTTITSGPSGSTTATTAQIAFTSDDEGATYQCRLDSAPWAACTSAVSLTGVGIGPHTFQVRATDAVGNTDQTPAESTWTVTQQTPETTITGGPTGTVFEFSATLTFTSSDPSTTFECQMNGDGWTPCTSPASYLNLFEGVQLFEVRAKTLDGVVDPTPATRTWTIQSSGGGIS